MAQGQIDQILSAHPEDRRTIFEEAAGHQQVQAPEEGSAAQARVHRGQPGPHHRHHQGSQTPDHFAAAPGRQGPPLQGTLRPAQDARHATRAPQVRPCINRGGDGHHHADHQFCVQQSEAFSLPDRGEGTADRRSAPFARGNRTRHQRSRQSRPRTQRAKPTAISSASTTNTERIAEFEETHRESIIARSPGPRNASAFRKKTLLASLNTEFEQIEGSARLRTGQTAGPAGRACGNRLRQTFRRRTPR
jgi:hypothetical protein